ncbi:isochorismate synthase [Nocardia sp. alder85J]|uniref:isochorismate synthase n=1 Tax=Nocardia sp. alder85J TaxID=2862949 RepID=UPI001CD5A1D1|nr:isochorismate synthase [Nocardia sp. alder85J]MCX4093338.1 isochorismate synthase [Nocardia sp. alder85J]
MTTISTSLPSLDVTTASFALSRPHRTVLASAGRQHFSTIAEAAAALRSGRATHVVGALAFDPGAPAALWAPDTLTVDDTGPLRPAPAPDLPDFRVDAAVPEPELHVDRVRRTVAALSEPGATLRKVVLARALRLTAGRPVAASDVLGRLVSGDASGNGYLVDLTAAGRRGRYLVGSSPEVLVRREGPLVTSYPLAGSTPRTSDPEADMTAGTGLLASPKNLREHRFVVDHVRTALARHCDDVTAPELPELTATPVLWHLGSRITGLARTGSTVLDLAAALHPTPAVCGTPTRDAAALIGRLEGDRGFYAGAVGWCDAAGNGEWMVSIRCAELAADGRTLLAHAGGGIVADSDPEDELSETVTKFETMLRALGVVGAGISG